MATSIYKKPEKTASSDANLALLNANFASEDNPYATQDDLEALESGAVQRTGVAISFDKDAYYNTPDSPGTGNITIDLTDAKLGVTGCILHNSGSAPTLTGFTKLSSSGDYVTGELNYIYYNYISSDKIVYTVSQET